MEQIWQPDPDYWMGQAPLLFPICGGLKDDKFIYGGKEYFLEKHGFGRTSEFDIESATDTSASFLLSSSAKTRLQYPFDFELRVIYELSECELKVTYKVLNKTDEEMYYSIGAHEGYSCPEGIEEYSVVFEKEEDFISSNLLGNLLEDGGVQVSESGCELPLKTEFFAIDALVFLNNRSRSAALLHRASGRKITVNYEGFDYFLLWTKPGAKYICLEPWRGVPDFTDSNYDIRVKRGILKIAPFAEDISTHSVIF
jgi:galactose mutarotase-like enzyme